MPAFLYICEKYNAMSKRLIFCIVSALLLTVVAYAQKDSVAVGDIAPALSGANVYSGDQITLEKGKVTLIIFWAPWCPYCVKELKTPEMAQMMERLVGVENFRLIAVAVDKPENVVLFLDKNPECSYIKEVTFCDPARVQYKEYAPKYIPRTYLVNKSGTVVKAILDTCTGDQIKDLSDTVASLVE